MRYLWKIFLVLFFGLLSFSLSAQGDCKVLIPEIAGQYTGKCKNGLAHGKGKAVGQDTYEGGFSKGLPDGTGTYIWANGDMYTGDWYHGIKQGEGTLKFKFNERDSLITGIWENDIYKGPVPLKPHVLSCVSIDRYTFKNTGNQLNRVLLNFYQNGVRNLTIENLLLSTSSGTDTRLGQSVGYENILFPVTIKATYTTMNKARTATVYAIFEFEIFEPGDWEVDIYN